MIVNWPAFNLITFSENVISPGTRPSSGWDENEFNAGPGKKLASKAKERFPSAKHIVLCNVTNLVPSGKVASIWTSSTRNSTPTNIKSLNYLI